MIWLPGRPENSVRASTYFGSAIFVAFSLVILSTAYVLENFRIFVALFSVGAAIIAVTCYFALVSTISKRALRLSDVGTPCGYATNRRVGVCPDTHDEKAGKCVKRTSQLDAGGKKYVLSDNVTPANIPHLEVADLQGMSTEDVSNLCKSFKGKPYTALTTMGRECVHDT